MGRASPAADGLFDRSRSRRRMIVALQSGQARRQSIANDSDPLAEPIPPAELLAGGVEPAASASLLPALPTVGEPPVAASLVVRSDEGASAERPDGDDFSAIDAPIAIDRKPSPALSLACLPVVANGPGLERLERSLAQAEPLTWVFAGDNLEPVSAESREWRSFTSWLVERIRIQLGRGADGIIIQTEPAGRLTQLARGLHARVLRYRPDIVYLSISPDEALRGLRELAQFEAELFSTIEQVSTNDGLVLLATPPVVPAPDTDDLVNQQVYAEAIRAAAAEFDLPLIDHFAVWEAAYESSSGLGDWLVPGHDRPGPLGHRLLAEVASRALWLDSRAQPLADVDEPVRARS
ncbi:MAG: hypothetical protein R3B90_07585 [Planctomycetaceae bacterium]